MRAALLVIAAFLVLGCAVAYKPQADGSLKIARTFKWFSSVRLLFRWAPQLFFLSSLHI